MTLIDIICEKMNNKFEQTSNLKEADLVYFKGLASSASEIVFLKSTIATQLVGYILNQQNYIKETANRTINMKGVYSEIVMYKKKDKDEILPWHAEKLDINNIMSYFKQ